MKVLVSLLTFSNALTNDEISKFGCRNGEYYQYSQGRGGSENNVAYQLNQFFGCHPDQARPCVKESMKCKTSLSNDGRTLIRDCSTYKLFTGNVNFIWRF